MAQMYTSVSGHYYFTQEKLNTSVKKTKESAKLHVGGAGNKDWAAVTNSSTHFTGHASWWVGRGTDAKVTWILV